MGQVLLFSLTAMANPTLVAATTVMLLLDNPKRLMLGYLAGALLVSVTLGLVIVFSLKDSAVVSTAKHTINPIADLAVGGLLLVVALVLHTGRDEALRRRRSERRAGKDKQPPRWQRALSGGSARTTFLVGIVLTLPGASYLAALHAVIKLDPSTLEAVLLVLMINVIMLTLLELPLISFAVAPEWTPSAIERAKSWFGRHARRIVLLGTAILGSLLIVRGVITLLAG